MSTPIFRNVIDAIIVINHVHVCPTNFLMREQFYLFVHVLIDVYSWSMCSTYLRHVLLYFQIYNEIRHVQLFMSSKNKVLGVMCMIKITIILTGHLFAYSHVVVVDMYL